MSQPMIYLVADAGDEAEKKQVAAHLKAVRGITVWSDDQIQAGADWQAEIAQALARADIALLLITAGFLGSDFINDTILPRLLERQAAGELKLIPVIAKPCVWQAADWLAGLRVRPPDQRPVWRDGGRHADEELARIVAEIVALLRGEPAPVPPGQRPPDSPVAPSAGAATQMGGLNLSQIHNSDISIGAVDARITAGGDVVAGNKQEIHYHYYGAELDLVEEKPLQPFEPEMVTIPAGPFTLGSDSGEPHEAPAHTVTLSQYQISQYPITQAQYLAYVEKTGAAAPAKAGWELARVGQKPPDAKLDHPIIGVSWDEAVDYCRWLSQQTGRKYRLPTEAEWEKAARGAQGARAYPWGDQFDPARCHHGGSDTRPVDAFSPAGDSPFGCADMAGNVWEWTSTIWGRDRANPNFNYPYPPQPDGRDDPPGETGLYREYRLCRGGSYADKPARLRCSSRARFAANSHHPRRGFRIVREI